MNPLRAAQRFYEMRSSWLGDGGQPVPQVQANARAAVCLSCPKNKPHMLYEILTVPAIAEVQHQLNLRGEMGLSVKGEENVHVCESCWCILRLKVHTPIEHLLKTTDLSLLPENCWILDESKTWPNQS